MNEHQTYAYFYVKEFSCLPEEIARILKIEATHQWCKGELWGENDSRMRNESFWSYRTSSSSNDPYSNSHFKELLSVLESRVEELSQLPAEARIGITYVSTYYCPNMAVVLEKSLLKRIVSLGLELDFDIYSLDSSDE